MEVGLHAALVGEGRIPVLDLWIAASALTGTSNGFAADLIRFGVNYRF